MLRLKNLKEENDIVMIENGLFKIFSKKDIERMKEQKATDAKFWFSLNYKKELEDCLNKKTEVNSYIRFIKTIREETAKKIPGSFLVVYKDNKFYVFKSDMYDSQYKFITIYKPESEAILEFTLKLFRIDDNKNFAVINSSVENHFAFITTWQILEILYTKVDIESSGEEMYTKFYKPKKSGGMREIIAPHEKIKQRL